MGKKDIDAFSTLHNLPPVFSMAGAIVGASTEEPHRHSWHEFVAISSGVAVIESDTWRVPIYNPLVAIVPAGMWHRFLAVETPFSFNAVFFRQELWNPGDGGLRLYRLGGLGSALLARLAHGTGRDLSEGIEGQVARLFLAIAEEELSDAVAPAPLLRPLDDRARSMVDLIESRWNENIALVELGKVANCSPRHAQRLFRSETGMTPLEYIRAHRMIRAAVSLADRKRTILDISLECGYSSSSTFYSDFKRYHGISPGEFRSKILGHESRLSSTFGPGFSGSRDPNPPSP